MIGSEIYEMAVELFPICRSLTGDGVRQTLELIKKRVPELLIKEVPTGTQVFDWTIPKEWKIREAYIEDSLGNRIIDFRNNNLHVVGYSQSLDIYCSKQELLDYIYVQEDQPDWIPYVTSYYAPRAGFCMSKTQRDCLKEDVYHAVIKSEFIQGNMTYGEIVIKGQTEKEILLSTYICHPSMANNELSGPCLCTYLANWIKQIPNRKYTYRIIFVPETIGSIAYISNHLEHLKRLVIAGFVVSCVGDQRTYSYVPTRTGNTLADRVAKNVLNLEIENYDEYTYLDRASDERQYNSPGVDLPVCVVCRSKYGTYPEYHTSADDLQFISPKGLEESFYLYQRMLFNIEVNAFYKVQCLCEPQLGKRGLYPNISKKDNFNKVNAMMDLLAYADGEHDLIEISNITKVPINKLQPIVEQLKECGLIKVCNRKKRKIN